MADRRGRSNRQDRRRPSKWPRGLPSGLSLAVSSSIFLLIYLTAGGEAINKLLVGPQQQQLRFCYQPGDQLSQQNAPISTQCVYCNKHLFDHTLFRCTGISAVQQYINTTQAFCIITQCLEQIRNQTPVLLGR